MEVGLIDSLLTVGNKKTGLIGGKGGNETDGFSNFLKKLTDANTQEVQMDELDDGNWNSVLTDENFSPLLATLFFDENTSPPDIEWDHNEIPIEDMKTLFEKIILDLSSKIDEEDQEEFSQLEQLVRGMDDTQINLSMLQFFNLLSQFEIPIQSNEPFDEDVVQLLNTVKQFFTNQNVDQKSFSQTILPILETLIQKIGKNVDLQSVYNRWNVGEGSKEGNILFPFPMRQDRFQVTQIRNMNIDPSNEDGMFHQGKSNGQVEGKMNVSLPLTFTNDNDRMGNKQNEQNNVPFSLNERTDLSSKSTKNEPVLNRIIEEKGPLQGEDKVLKNGEKTEGSVSVMNKTQPYQQTVSTETLKLVDRNQQPVSYKEFEQQFASILSRGNYIKNGNVQRLTVKLHPENLGTLKIELVQKNGEMIAKIISSTEKAKELLETQISTLRHAFIQQNIHITRIDMQTVGTSDRFEGQQQSYYGSGGSSKNEQNEDEDTNQESKEMSFQETLFNIEI